MSRNAGIPLSGRRLLALKLITVILSTVLSLAAAYGFYTWWQGARPIYLQQLGEEQSGHQYMYDSKMGWVNVPGFEGTTYGQELTINSKGLRDREYDYAKADGVKRILVLGDSFAWGFGVADEDVFTEVLERDLHLQGLPWEVLNGAVSGWGTDQQYLFLRDEGLLYEPDIVVLAFFSGNDFHNNVESVQYGLHKPVFVNTDLELMNSPVPKPTSDARRFRARIDIEEITLAIIQRMATECVERGCRLVVMQFGGFLYPDSPELVQVLQRFARNLAVVPDVAYLDLDAKFAEQGVSADRLLEGNVDGHWNREGHALAARYLQSFLRERSLLR